MDGLISEFSDLPVANGSLERGLVHNGLQAAGSSGGHNKSKTLLVDRFDQLAIVESGVGS
jgi:hypothetical protein